MGLFGLGRLRGFSAMDVQSPHRIPLALTHPTVLGLLCLQVCGAALDVGIALFALFMADRGASARELGWVLGSGWAIAVGASLLGGQAADRWGPRRTILAGTASVMLGLLGEALSRTWFPAGASYLLVQAGQAVLYPAVLRGIGAATREQAGSVLGFLHTCYSALGIPGALLAGWVAERWGWGVLYEAKAALYLGACAVLFVLLPKGNMAPRSARSEETRLWWPLLRHVALRYTCAAVILVTLCGYASSFYPYDLRARFGLGPAVLARFAAIYNAVWLLSNWPAGIASDRWGRRPVAVLGYGLMALAWAFFPWVSRVASLYALYALYSLGNSLGYYATLVAMEAVPRPEQGRAVGLFNACIQGGAALGESAGGALWGIVGATWSYLLAALGALAGALLLVRVRPPSSPARPSQT